MRVVTIGGYGYDEAGFLRALRDAKVDTFVDIRQRRGMRGARYSFLNSARLQKAVAGAGIRYLHLRDLAPTTEVRDAQKKADEAAAVGKRGRDRLSDEFVRGYRDHVLAGYSAEAFATAVGSEARVVALFCVEGRADACHRSLVAEFLREKMGVSVEHLRP